MASAAFYLIRLAGTLLAAKPEESISMKNLKKCSPAVASILALSVYLNQCAYAAELPRVLAMPQAAQTPPIAGPPSQIPTAHAIFLTNSTSDANFPLDPTKSFNDLYAALKAWNYYKLVGSPAEADLIFQLRETAPITNVSGYHGNVSSYASPAFQLDVIDPRTSISLWTITSPVNVAGKKQVLARWTAIAETNLVSRIKTLAGQPLSTVETADLTTVPKNHGLRTALIVTAVVVGAGVAAGVAASIVIHNDYENSLAAQKASQDQFCEANHIPLSQCAGG
jgi:hypothetical protein